MSLPEPEDTTRDETLETDRYGGAAQPGQLLGNRFTVVRQLGRGATGVAYLVKDELLQGAEVVLKLMTERAATDAEDRELFHREVLSARALHHPHVVRVFDYHMLGTVPAITMEYLGGGTLQEALQKEPSVEQLLTWLAQVADGLEAVHKAGIVHRDLKPQNIMLSSDGQARVTDFGIARPAERREVSIRYTPLYAAPEQVRGEALTARTDLYSFGAMAYYVLAKQPPYTREEVISGHPSPAPALDRVVKTLPKEVVSVVMQCLERDPIRRPRSAASVAGRLRAAAMELQPAKQAALMCFDMVVYRALATRAQSGALRAVRQILEEAPSLKRLTEADFLKVASPEGATLVFFGPALTAYRAALDMAQAMAAEEIQARVSLHLGAVKLVPDINGDPTPTGTGVAAAQALLLQGRVGQLLASEAFRDAVIQDASEEAVSFHGPYSVRDDYGRQQSFFSVQRGDIGLEDWTAPIRSNSGVTLHRVGLPWRRVAVAMLGVVGTAALAVGIWGGGAGKTPTRSNAQTVAPAPEPPPPPSWPAPAETQPTENKAVQSRLHGRQTRAGIQGPCCGTQEPAQARENHGPAQAGTQNACRPTQT